MKLYLQNRWKLENNKLIYYGMRKKPYLLKNVLKLGKNQRKEIEKIVNDEKDINYNILSKLIDQKILVPKDEIKTTPTSIEDAIFCKECSANDFMIPGIEFDDDELCPMCTSKEETKELKSVVPIVEDLPRSRKSRFDVALFYTGGKDSSYLLYYLSKVKKLRVLALTWDIPFMSESAKLSLENAKKKLDNVEFVVRSVSNNDLRTAYNKLYQLNGNTCACPSFAYVLFYPLLVSEKVRYFILGNEPVQMKNLYYNSMAPKVAYSFSKNKFLNGLINIGRVLTLRKPYRKGQFHTLATMRQLAYGDSFFKKLVKYENPFLSNVIESIHQVKNLMKPLKRAIRISSITGNIPAFVHIDLNDISVDKVYDWNKVKDLIIDEVGWVAPSDYKKGLHTSCSIEKCKEYTQFIRFYNMKSRMIPFSAIELSLASRDKNLSKEEAIYEIKNCLGFSVEEPPECLIMKNYLNI